LFDVIGFNIGLFCISSLFSKPIYLYGGKGREEFLSYCMSYRIIVSNSIKDRKKQKIDKKDRKKQKIDRKR
jgi:hypothetical protein